MGNQASKAAAEKKRRHRRSTLTTQSHMSQGNYNWLEENEHTALSAGAISEAMAAAAVSSVPQEPPRRKSITEFFTKRKQAVDFREYDRLQRQHYLLKSARKANIWSPIDPDAVPGGMTIVDIGTGNGIWALEMAQRHLTSHIIGIDLKNPPDHAARPKNLNYVQADIHQYPWPLEDASVDFIFQRNMSTEIQRNQWLPLFREMLRVLKPGGHIEILEPDPAPHNPGPVQQAFDGFLRTQWSDNGYDYLFASSIEDQLSQVGFEEIDIRTLDIPIGEWPDESELKQFGFINKETQKAYFKNRKQEFSSQWGIASEDYDQAVQEIMEEFDDYHGFSRYHCWMALKPATTQQQQQASATS